jgi:hypothetical protein
MVEFYESATVLSITGERQFGICGWQAACRMIKKVSPHASIRLNSYWKSSGQQRLFETKYFESYLCD